MLKVKHLSLANNSHYQYTENIDLVKPLLAQLLVEYKFLLQIEGIVNYHLELNNCSKIKTFRDLVEASNPPSVCPESISISSQSLDSEIGPLIRYLESEKISEVFSDYQNTKIVLTAGQINDMLSELDVDNIEKYYKQLLDRPCNIETIYKQFTNPEVLDAVYDARNYSIWLLNKYLSNSLDLKTDYLYLIYQENLIGKDLKIIASHVFVYYFDQNNLFEAISIQTSLYNLVSTLCLDNKSGLSIQLFNYILEEILPRHPDAGLIYAQAWPKMSSILVYKFGFTTIEYDSGVFIISDKDGKAVLRSKNGKPAFTDKTDEILSTSGFLSKNKIEDIVSLIDNWNLLSDQVNADPNYIFTFKILSPINLDSDGESFDGYY